MPITLDGTLGITTPAINVTGSSTFTSGSFTNLAYTGTLTGGTGVVNLGSGQFYKDASGNVGIGTSSPAAPLDVNGKIYSRTGGLYSDSFNSYSGGATTFGNGSSYSAFYVGATERMRIDSSGNVGIGTATPQAKLHANSANNATSLFLTPNSGSSAGDYTQLGFGNSAASATVYGGIRTAFVNPAATSSVSMQFWTDSGSSTYAERMRITQSGGVSIGTATDPGATNLLVQGQIYTNSLAATGVLYMGAGGLISTIVNELCFNASTGCLGVDQGTPTVPMHVGTLAQAMPSGADIACRNSIAAGAGFCTKPNSYGAFSGHAFSIDFTGPCNLWIDYTNVGAFTLTSDYRLKENISSIPDGALNRVMKIETIQFNRKTIEMFKGSEDIEEGFIAHQLQSIIPSGISGSKDELTEKGTIQPQSVNFGPIVAVLTKAIQEQQALIDNLTTRLTALENK